MFKSCHYCQHRKKKCVSPPPSSSTTDSRCLACQHLDISCEVGLRRASLKRQRKSPQIASKLYARLTVESDPPSALLEGQSENVVTRVHNGDCQLLQPDTGAAATKIIISNPLAEEDIEQLTTR